MPNNYLDITNVKFGKIIALHIDKDRPSKKRERWIFLCDCGNKKSICKYDVLKKTKPIRSCGCTYKLSMESILNKYIKIENNGCWNWIGWKDRKGYGQAHFQSKRFFSHRLSWIFYKGEIPIGLYVCHKCDNPSCCNPDHLFLGTQKDNIQDMMKKGRGNIKGSIRLDIRGDNHPRRRGKQ